MTGKDASATPRRAAISVWLAGFATALLLLAGQPAAHAQNSLAEALQQQSEFLPVREAYQLDGAVTADGTLRLYWRITEGYYLYQHAFKVRDYDSPGAPGMAIEFPPAIAKTDEFFGDVSVYYDEADLSVGLSGVDAPLTLAVTYQGCADAGLCYPPETDYLKVDVTTARSLRLTLASNPLV